MFSLGKRASKSLKDAKKKKYENSDKNHQKKNYYELRFKVLDRIIYF